MANPVVASYSAPPPIRAGRWPGGRLSGAVAVSPVAAAAALAGSLGNVRISFYGQSNPIGRADQSDLSASPLSADPELAQYMAGTLPLSRALIWVPGSNAYEVLTAANSGATAGQFGPEFGMAVHWMRNTPAGLIIFEKWAISGASINNDAFTPGVYPYTVAVGYRTAGNAWLAAQGIVLSHDDWAWWQAESDAGMAQAPYQGRLEGLMTGLSADGVRPSNGRDVLIQMAAGTAGYGAGPVAAKAAIAAANPTRISTLIAPADMKADGLHQNGLGQMKVSHALCQRLYGITPTYV